MVFYLVFKTVSNAYSVFLKLFLIFVVWFFDIFKKLLMRIYKLFLMFMIWFWKPSLMFLVWI